MNNILLCVTGGIAAYKSIELASRLIKQGFAVKTILTKNALEFVTELNFTTITKNFAYSEMFLDSCLRRNDGHVGYDGKVRNDGHVGNDGKVRNNSHENTDPIPHISLADWADLVVVAPATANMIAKAAHGIADDLMTSVLLAHTKPVLWVPAMNVHMYEHLATQDNIKTLLKRKNYILEPVTGMLACGYEGKGKFPPVEEIVDAIQVYLYHTQDLKGKKVLVTAGGTVEPIDPMRQITNCSSGRTGVALARSAALRGAEVFLVYGYIAIDIPYYLKDAIFAPTVAAMKKAVDKLFPQMDITIMAAAVSDFAPDKVAKDKIKKSAKLTIELKQTPDILAGLGKMKQKKQLLIGFAAESENIIANAKVKLEKKKLDMIIANHISVAGHDATEITIITKKSSQSIKACKLHAANVILDCINSI